MSEKVIKALRYIIIEILYIIAMYFYFDFVEKTYGMNTAYEFELYSIIILGALFLIGFIGPMLNRYVLFLYAGTYTLYLVTQSIYNRAFQQYYRFNTVKDLFSEMVGVKESAFEFVTQTDLLPFYVLAAITIVFIVFYFWLQRRCIKLLYRLPFKLAFLLLFFPAQTHFNTYNQLLVDAYNQEDSFQLYKTDYYVYDTIPSTTQFVDIFGILPFGYRDAEVYLTKDVLSANSRQLIEEYLSNKQKEEPNDFTGIFEGKQLIVIQAESYNNIALDPDLTPTLYRMATEGICVKNFNTPLLVGSTSDTEFMANTSLIPECDGRAVCYAYPNNTYPTSLAKLFNDADYFTTIYHNNYGEYYNRDLMFESWEYDHFYDSTELGFTDSIADSEVMEVMKWIFADADYPYFAYWITYSGHQPYTTDSCAVSENNLELIRNKFPNITDENASYLAKNMDLDQSMDNLINLLKHNGRLRDVVFIFFGDHTVKGINLSANGTIFSQMGLEYSPTYNYTDLYIYNSQIEPMEFEKVATALDLLPTIANMWNLDYDYTTTMGHDIFDPDYEGLYFCEYGNWKTDNFAYDFVSDTIVELKEGYTREQAEQAIEDIYEMKNICHEILKLDYFAEE